MAGCGKAVDCAYEARNFICFEEDLLTEKRGPDEWATVPFFLRHRSSYARFLGFYRIAQISSQGRLPPPGPLNPSPVTPPLKRRVLPALRPRTRPVRWDAARARRSPSRRGPPRAHTPCSIARRSTARLQPRRRHSISRQQGPCQADHPDECSGLSPHCPGFMNMNATNPAVSSAPSRTCPVGDVSGGSNKADRALPARRPACAASARISATEKKCARWNAD